MAPGLGCPRTLATVRWDRDSSLPVYGQGARLRNQRHELFDLEVAIASSTDAGLPDRVEVSRRVTDQFVAEDPKGLVAVVDVVGVPVATVGESLQVAAA